MICTQIKDENNAGKMRHMLLCIFGWQLEHIFEHFPQTFHVNDRNRHIFPELFREEKSTDPLDMRDFLLQKVRELNALEGESRRIVHPWIYQTRTLLEAKQVIWET